MEFRNGEFFRTNSNSNSPIPANKVKRMLNNYVDELLKMCTTFNFSWDNYTEIYEKLQKINEIEIANQLPTIDRKSNFPKFLEWLSSNGAVHSNVEIALFDDTGYGIKALQHIEKNELWLTIPRKLMLSLETIQNPALIKLIRNDKLLQNMPNVALAVCLLSERCTKNSFWTSYIDTLPDEYDTPMFFNLEELEYLKGSPVLETAINQCVNITRQYAYLHKLLQKQPKNGPLGALSKNFTYENYRWCVSALMTRQNHIPSPDGSTQLLALVPMWDMCNHTNGELSTDYNMEQNQLESYAFRSFGVGEQVFIFYGSRPNAELLVHNGFIYGDNPFDTVSIRLELRKSDPMYAKKIDLMHKLELPKYGCFTLDKICPVDGTLLAFHRILAMNEDVLQKCLENDKWHQLKDLDFKVDPTVDLTCWKLLNARLKHMLISSSDKKEASSHSSTRAQMAILLRISERRILETALDFVCCKVNNKSIH